MAEETPVLRAAETDRDRVTPEIPETTACPEGPRPGPAVPPVPAFPRAQRTGTRPAQSVLGADAQDGRPLAGKAPVTPSGATPDLAEPVPGGRRRTAGRAPGPAVGESEPAAGSGVKGLQALAAAMSEDELERGMRRILKDLGLRLAYHPWKLHAKRAREGFPDWTITGPGGLIFRELKTEAGKVTPAQQEWLAALAAAGADAGVWRPLHLLDGTIARELADLAGYGGTR